VLGILILLLIKNGYDFPKELLHLTINGHISPDSFIQVQHSIASLWIVGEIIACVSELKQGDMLAPLNSLRRILRPSKYFTYDDWRLSDPLPFFLELLHYGLSFLKAGGNINPVEINMMK
jgi:hypothetical protein